MTGPYLVYHSFDADYPAGVPEWHRFSTGDVLLIIGAVNCTFDDEWFWGLVDNKIVSVHFTDLRSNACHFNEILDEDWIHLLKKVKSTTNDSR